MFKRSSVRYGRTPEPITPYQRAAQLWDDRIGSARVQAHSWRLACFASLFLSAGLSAALVWQAARGSVTPWIVEVDKLGEAKAIAPADHGYEPTDPQIAFHLASFIENVRALPADPVVLRENWLRAYDFTSEKGAQILNGYARTNDPFADVGKVQVAVDISSVIRSSDDSFRIAWTERRYRDGGLEDSSRWSAIVSINIRQPKTVEALRRNPLGLLITSINWSKELAQ